MGLPHCCAGAFPGKYDETQVLEGLTPSIQIVGSLLGNPWSAKPARKIGPKVCLVISPQWKKALNYFLLNAFGKVKNLTNLPTKILKIRVPSLLNGLMRWYHCQSNTLKKFVTNFLNTYPVAQSVICW